MREAASIPIIKELVNLGAKVVAYDPIATSNARNFLPADVIYTEYIDEALSDAELAFIITEWNEIKEIPLHSFEALMKEPVIFDGRNCYSLDDVKKYSIGYYSIGRNAVLRNKKSGMVTLS